MTSWFSAEMASEVASSSTGGNEQAAKRVRRGRVR
jgi:hypothetical protein